MPDNIQGSNLKRFMQRKPVKVVAVCSGKGGVGKTNVASNIAVALGSRGRNTCLLDADLSLANVDVLLGLQPRFNLSHVVEGEAELCRHNPARPAKYSHCAGVIRKLLYDRSARSGAGWHHPGFQRIA